MRTTSDWIRQGSGSGSARSGKMISSVMIGIHGLAADVLIDMKDEHEETRYTCSVAEAKRLAEQLQAAIKAYEKAVGEPRGYATVHSTDGRVVTFTVDGIEEDV
jgi:hypothetical protein